MNFFKNLFFGNKKDKNEELKTEKFENNSSDLLKLYEEIILETSVGEKFQTELKNELKKAFSNPEKFYEETAEYSLEDRGLSFPKDKNLTPKFVYVDKMIENDQMAEVDWKEEEGDVRYVINLILKSKGFNFQISEEEISEYGETFEVLNAINKNELNSEKLSLEILDINSDSYVFTIVPLDKSKKVTELFSQIK